MLIQEIWKKTKYPHFWEITSIALLLIGIDFIFFPGNPGYHALPWWFPLNPFLLLILLSVLRYGISWGYYATMISGLYYFFTPPYGLDDFIGRLPALALFSLSLLVFGQIHNNFAGKIRQQEEKLEDLQKRFQQLNENYELTSFLKDNYEKKILTQTTTMSDLYQDAENMQVLLLDELYDKVLHLVRKYVEAQKCSIYILNNGELLLKGKLGYDENEKGPPLKIDSTEEPYRLVFEKHELISINEGQFKESILSRIPVYIGPLVKSDGEIMGILNVDSISLLKFNAITRKTFSLICNWASKAVENAWLYKSSEASRIIDPEFLIFRPHYFKARLDEAIEAAMRTDTGYAFLSVEIMGWEDMLEKYKKSVLKFTCRIIGQTIKEFDILSRSPGENRLWILMSHVSASDLEKFFNKMNVLLDTFNIKPFDGDSKLEFQINSCCDFKNRNSADEIISAAMSPQGTKVSVPFGELKIRT